jgi:hypothetical protein
VRRQLDRVHDAVTDTVTLELSHLSSDSSPARVTLPLGVDAADVRCTFRRRARQLQATVPLGLNSAFEILAATGHTELLRTLFGAPPQRVQPCVHRRHLTAHSPHAADATQQKSFHAAVFATASPCASPAPPLPPAQGSSGRGGAQTRGYDRMTVRRWWRRRARDTWTPLRCCWSAAFPRTHRYARSYTPPASCSLTATP